MALTALDVVYSVTVADTFAGNFDHPRHGPDCGCPPELARAWHQLCDGAKPGFADPLIGLRRARRLLRTDRRRRRRGQRTFNVTLLGALGALATTPWIGPTAALAAGLWLLAGMCCTRLVEAHTTRAANLHRHRVVSFSELPMRFEMVATMHALDLVISDRAHALSTLDGPRPRRRPWRSKGADQHDAGTVRGRGGVPLSYSEEFETRARSALFTAALAARLVAETAEPLRVPGRYPTLHRNELWDFGTQNPPFPDPRPGNAASDATSSDDATGRRTGHVLRPRLRTENWMAPDGTWRDPDLAALADAYEAWKCAVADVEVTIGWDVRRGQYAAGDPNPR